jgi:serine/threonine-protein kinase
MVEAAFDRLKTALASRCYTIERELGSGGMATVYLAEDLKHHRKVVVKVFHYSMSYDAHRVGFDRLVHEAQISTNLIQHPSILPIEHVSTFDTELDGFYVVSPWVPGESLRSYMDTEGPFSVSRSMLLSFEIATVLQVAHDANVVHRNLKPENVLLENAHRRVVLADFVGQQQLGIDLEETDPPSSWDFHYASPEVLSGSWFDGRADQYSLACIIYEMLCGIPPFTGQNVVRQQLIAPPPTLSVPTRPSLQEGITEAIERALSKEPDDRFNSVADFAEAMRKTVREVSV